MVLFLMDRAYRVLRNKLRQQYLLRKGLKGIFVCTNPLAALECDYCSNPGSVVHDGRVLCLSCTNSQELEQFRIVDAEILAHMGHHAETNV